MPTEDEKKALKEVGTIGLDSIANVAIAFGVIFALNQVLVALGFTGEGYSFLGFGLLLGLIFAEPMALFRGDRSLRKFLFYACAGVALAFIIDLATNASLPAETAANTEAAAQSEDKPFPWFLILLVFIAPAVFMLPVLEKVLGVEKDAAAPSREDIAISLAFPILMSFTMLLHMGVIGALWLVGASLAVGAAVYLAGIALVVVDVAFGEVEDEPGLDGKWRPRAASAEESWANLRKGLSLSLASGLFLGASLYLSLQLTVPADFGDMGEDMTGFLFSFLAFAGLMLVVSLLLFGLGVALAAFGALALARLNGADPLTMTQLAERSVARLLMGGMGWVRPDLPEDNQSR